MIQESYWTVVKMLLNKMLRFKQLFKPTMIWIKKAVTPVTAMIEFYP